MAAQDCPGYWHSLMPGEGFTWTHSPGDGGSGFSLRSCFPTAMAAGICLSKYSLITLIKVLVKLLVPLVELAPVKFVVLLVAVELVVVEVVEVVTSVELVVVELVVLDFEKSKPPPSGIAAVVK